MKTIFRSNTFTSTMMAFVMISYLASCSPKVDPKTQMKVVRLSLGDDVKSADPVIANDVISAEMMGNIFEGLVGFSYLGKLGQIEPLLAESLPAFSKDLKTVTFKVRKGIFFQDDPAFADGKGREVTAEDFVFSFKRIADPANGSTNWWMYDGVVEGFNEWRDAIDKAPKDQQKALFDKPVKGIEATDNITLVFHLKKPYPQLLSILAMVPGSVIAREVADKYGAELGNHPVGTGPYKLKEWTRGSKIIVERNPKYRTDKYPSQGTEEQKQAGLLVAGGKVLPFAEEVQWDIIKEDQPRWLKFRKGELDETGIPKDNFSEAIEANGQLKAELQKDGIQLHKEMSLTSWWIEFNLKDPVLGKSLKLRQALAHAFDRARALELLSNNRGVLAASPVPPVLEGGSQIKSYPYEFNIEKAKKLLAEAGYPEGKGLPELTFDLRGPGATARQLGEFVQDNFSKIGVKVRILGNSFPEALEKAKTARFQMMPSGWAADYPDPENFLQLFYGPNHAPGTNTANFDNKEYNKLYEQIRTELPGNDRAKAIVKMAEIVQEEVPGIMYYHALDYTLSQSWLKNYHPHLLLYGWGKFLDIDNQQKYELLKAR